PGRPAVQNAEDVLSQHLGLTQGVLGQVRVRFPIGCQAGQGAEAEGASAGAGGSREDAGGRCSGGRAGAGGREGQTGLSVGGECALTGTRTTGRIAAPSNSSEGRFLVTDARNPLPLRAAYDSRYRA